MIKTDSYIVARASHHPRTATMQQARLFEAAHPLLAVRLAALR
jgi:hypothetical protein